MTKWMVVVALACFASTAACSSDTDTTSGSSGTGTTDQGLSAAFTKSCARCHGATGEGSSTYPKIPGGKDEAGFIAIVRSGRGDMPSFDATVIGDADLKADYLWLTTKR